MHYYVVGVNGSGKTTLLKAIHEQVGIALVHSTSELMSHLGISGDYDALRGMDQTDVLVKYGTMAEQLLKQYEGKDLLLDTHLLNLTHGEVIRRDGPWIAKYDAAVLLKAQPAILLKRIEADASKDRAMFNPNMDEESKLKMIANYQAETEKLFTLLCKEYELPSTVINNDGHTEDAVRAFINFHQVMS